MRGYKVLYKAIAISNEKLEEDLETREVKVQPSKLSAVLENLNAFTRYEIEVLAYTVKGDGVKSKAIRAGNLVRIRIKCVQPVLSAGKHTTGVKCVKHVTGFKRGKSRNRCQEQENMQPISSAGNRVSDANRGEHMRPYIIKGEKTREITVTVGFCFV